MAENINLDAVAAGLKSVRLLRCASIDLFKLLSDGIPMSSTSNATPNQTPDNVNNTTSIDSKDKFYLNDVQAFVNIIYTRVRELETSCTLLAPPSVQVHLHIGNSSLVGQDPHYEKTPLYNSLTASYRWSDKLHEYATHAANILNKNSPKRTHPFSGASSVISGPFGGPKRFLGPGGAHMIQQPFPRRPPAGHNYSIQQVDSFCHNLQRLFPDMNMEVVRPFGTPVLLKITLGRVLKGVVVLRGLIIEWVLIKGFTETFDTEDGKSLDIWTKSRYNVFKQLTDHANAVLLHFNSPTHPDIAVKSFVTWLHSYASLFSSPCRKCGCRLLNNMPPTWRDVSNLEIYHDSCRP